MKKQFKKGIILATTSGLLLSGLALVTAQQNNSDTTANVIQAQHRGGPGGFHMQGNRGDFMPGIPGLRGNMLSEGSTVLVSFYDADPAQGGNELSSHRLNVGTDSELSFAQDVRDAMQTAAYAVVNVSAQSRTLELAEQDTGGKFGFRALGLRSLTEGSSLEAIFYDGNPEQGAAITTTLNFTAGTDSELAFENAFSEATSSANYVSINTSAQERSIDLTQVRAQFNGTFEGRMNGFGPGNFGRNGFGQDGFGPGKHRGPGGFGPGNMTPDSEDDGSPQS